MRDYNENGIKSALLRSPNYDDYFHQNFGKKLIAKNDTKAAFCGIFEAGSTIRVIMVYAGEQSGVNAR